MATTKLSDFIKALESARRDKVMLSVGIDVSLVVLLHDILTAVDSSAPPLVDTPRNLIERCHVADETGEPVSCRLGPVLCSTIIDMDAVLNESKNKFTELEQLRSMRDFIAQSLSKLNPARGRNDAADKAIDDICSAIDIANDPTVIAADITSDTFSATGAQTNTAERICKTCGEPETNHDYRHPFKG